MSAATIFIIALTTFLTSVVSGVFGMAGGMILMVVLFHVMPVAGAMILHACIQITANAWRCWLWRRHIIWRIVPPYLAGIVTGLILISLVGYVPDKSVALLLMGSLPLAAIAVEKRIRLDALHRGHAFVVAVLLTFVQMTAGVVGALLDLLYINAPFTRQQIISTKAFTQGSMHFVRIVYYGVLIPLLIPGTEAWPADLAPVFLLGFMAAAIAGTSLAALVVRRMTDGRFKSLSRWLIVAISLYCIGRGLFLRIS